MLIVTNIFHAITVPYYLLSVSYKYFWKSISLYYILSVTLNQ